jgi:putative Mn2+ efflux pump MntP
MATENPAKRLAQGSRHSTLGPPILFAAALVLAFAALGVTMIILEKSLAFAVMSTLLFALAAVIALAAWALRARFSGAAVTYWDVAGALLLIGIGAGVLIDADQLVRLVEVAPRKP